MKKEALIKMYLKYQLIIFPVLIILASLILIIFVIFPQIAKLISNNQQLGRMNQSLTSLEVKAQQLDTLDEAEIGRKLSISLTALPKDQDFVQTVGVIQSIVSLSSFSLASLQFGQSPPGNLGASAFAVKVEVSGPKIALPQLLESIESSQRVMKVTSLEVATTPSGDIVNVSMSIIAFYSSIPQSLGAIDAPLPKLTEEDEKLIATLAKTTSTVVVFEATPVTFGPRGKEDPFE